METMNLARSKQIYETLFDHSITGMAIVSLEGCCLRVNQALCRMFEYTEKEAQKIDFRSFFFKGNSNTDSHVFARLFFGEINDFTDEIPFICKSGKPIWISLHVALTRNDTGKPDFYIYQFQEKTNEKIVQLQLEEEISERKVLDSRLKEKEQELLQTGRQQRGKFFKVSDRYKVDQYLIDAQTLYRNLVEQSLMGVFLIQESKFLYVNPHMTTIFGYEPEQFVEMNLENIIVKDDLDSLIEQTAKSGSKKKKNFRFRVRGYKKDITLVYLEGHISTITYRGRPAIIGTVQDITYKKESDDILHESVQGFQRIIKFLPEPIVVLDGGRIIHTNVSMAKLLKATLQDELLGKKIYDFIHPDHLEEAIKNINNLSNTDEPSEFHERRLICTDGNVIEVEVSSIRVRNYMGKTVVLSVIRDLTERKQAEELMLRSEKLSVVGQLAAGVAHEIRNPLTAIKGFIQLLKPDLQNKSAYVELMLSELERINFIVSEFMTLARPHMTKFHIGSISEILKSVISLLETHAILMNVNIFIQMEDALPNIYCDENQLKQVFVNVIKNAVEAMPNGGDITINVTRQNCNIMISITDQGAGIPEELIAKIGEPFYTTKENGNGLGLMICHRIIEAHKGTIHVTSERNKGTKVDILLPVTSKLM